MNIDANNPSFFPASAEKKKSIPRPDESSLLDDYYRDDGRYTLFPPPAQEYVLCMKVDDMLLEVPDDTVFLAPTAESAKPAVPGVPAAPPLPIAPLSAEKSSYSYRRRRIQRSIINDPWSSEADKTKAQKAESVEETSSRLMQLSQTGRKPAEKNDTISLPGSPAKTMATPVSAKPAEPSSYHKRRMERALNDPWRSAEYPIPAKEPEPAVLPFASTSKKAAPEPPVIRKVQQPAPMPARQRSEKFLQGALRTNLIATAADEILLPLALDDDFEPNAGKSKQEAPQVTSTHNKSAVLFPPVRSGPQTDRRPLRDIEEGFLLSLDDMDMIPPSQPNRPKGVQSDAWQDAHNDLTDLENQLKRTLSHVEAGVSSAPSFSSAPAAVSSSATSSTAAEPRQTPQSTNRAALPVPPVPHAPVRSAGSVVGSEARASVSNPAARNPAMPSPARPVSSQGLTPNGASQAAKGISPSAPPLSQARARESSGDPLISDASALPVLRPRTAGHAKTNGPGRPEFEPSMERPHSDVENRRATLAAAGRHPLNKPHRRFNLVDADVPDRRSRWDGVSLVDDNPPDVAEVSARSEGWGGIIRSFLTRIFLDNTPSIRKNLLAFSYGGLKNTDFNPKHAGGAVSGEGETTTRSGESGEAFASSEAQFAADFSVVPLAPASQSVRTTKSATSSSLAPSLEPSPGFVTWDESDDDDDIPLWTPPSTVVPDDSADDMADDLENGFSLESLAHVVPNESLGESEVSKQKRGGLLSWLSQLFKGEEEQVADVSTGQSPPYTPPEGNKRP